MNADFHEKRATLVARFLAARLPAQNSRHLVMITGARQTGKTTLAQQTYSSLRHISLDEIEARFQLRDIPTRSWAAAVGPAILDEAQKEPSLFEKVKFAFDQHEIDFSVLLGSSQILMLKRIRETLAGRVFVYELWPLLLREMTCQQIALTPPLFDRLLTTTGSANEIFADEPPVLIGEQAHHQEIWLTHALKWGSMPGLLDLSSEERREWLHSYTITYLERDLSDLARLDDLAPFRRFQQLVALRTGQLLSYADLSRDAGISPNTARNYLNYLMLSYQAYQLSPYHRSPTKRMVKAPKIYWLDPGLWRQQTGYWGQITGPLLESFVVGECQKWINTMARPAEIFFYRTYAGHEVDIVVTSEHGLWGIEIKISQRAERSQTSALRRLAAQLGDEWLGGLLVYMGNRIEQLGHNLWAVPVGRLFG